MKQLTIFVCENVAPEFKKAVKKEKFDDVVIKLFPSMCENKRRKADTQRLLQECAENGDEGLVFCSKNCDSIKLVPKGAPFEIVSSGYCLSHLVNECLIEYIISQSGYIIGLGWLNHWREHIGNAGFDRDTARQFYKEFCNKLVFLDADIDKNAENTLKELSQFLDLPYVCISIELEFVQRLVKSAVYEWRLRQKRKEYATTLSEMQSQCSEYSSILDLMSKIANYTNKRDTIEKIKEIFVMIFGAQNFKYYEADCEKSNMPKEILDLFAASEKTYYLSKEENRICMKIMLRERERVKILDNLLRWKERRNAQKMEAENGKIQKAI